MNKDWLVLYKERVFYTRKTMNTTAMNRKGNNKKIAFTMYPELDPNRDYGVYEKILADRCVKFVLCYFQKNLSGLDHFAPLKLTLII